MVSCFSLPDSCVCWYCVEGHHLCRSFNLFCCAHSVECWWSLFWQSITAACLCCGSLMLNCIYVENVNLGKLNLYCTLSVMRIWGLRLGLKLRMLAIYSPIHSLLTNMTTVLMKNASNILSNTLLLVKIYWKWQLCESLFLSY